MSESSAAKSSYSSSLGLRRDAKNLDPCRTARMSEDVVVLATELLVEEDDVLGAVVLTTEDVTLETDASTLVTDVDLTVVVLGTVVANVVVFLNGVAALDVVMLMMTGEESGATASCPAVESLTELMVESSKSSLKVVSSSKASTPESRMPCWPAVAVTVTVVVMVVVS